MISQLATCFKTFTINLEYSLLITIIYEKIKSRNQWFWKNRRAFTRIALLRDTFDVVAINTRKPEPSLMAYLLQYDSVYRKFSQTVTHDEGNIIVNGKKIATLQGATPEEIPWEQYGVDVVIDATGAFVKKDDLKRHIKGSVREKLF